MTPPSTIPVAVDIVALTVIDHTLHVFIVWRGIELFRDHLVLPDGFLREGEQTEETVVHEFEEETGATPPGHLEQLFPYRPEDHDPCGPVLSVAYLLLAPSFSPTRSSGDATGALWHPVDTFLAPTSLLVFDHVEILADGVERARSKIEYSPLATFFYGPKFAIAQLRATCEAIWGSALGPRNPRHKTARTASFIGPTSGIVRESAGRPAALYCLIPGVDTTAFVLDPPLRRSSIPTPASSMKSASAPNVQGQPSTEGEPRTSTPSTIRVLYVLPP